MFLVLVAILAGLVIGVGVYLQHPKFGQLPKGERLGKIKLSPHYAEGEFNNLDPSPLFTEKGNALAAAFKYLFTRKERPAPPSPIPTVKTNFLNLDKTEDLVVWLGHSSYYIQLGGQRFLLDPVFSPNAAPVPLVNEAFAGTNIHTAEDFPEIDYLLISHDHWDHLDYPTVKALKPRIRKVICPLGVGAHFERWGWAASAIDEKDWNTGLRIGDDMSIHVLPARHFSGRLLTRNQSLWASFALVSPKHRLFFSGDSGYGRHFAEMGLKWGGFDYVFLDSGQYNDQWPLVHMTPEESAKAAEDLKAGAVIPAHVGRFSIAYHSWDEPFQRFSAAAQGKPYRFLTPKIGEPVNLDDPRQRFSRWWESIL
ncbi:MAG: MBL fold metallo-hydrolase [Candidatus Adiutrix sp.]|jgi:L-ascorbate metabolism protein UlaG (beta-lactamase superfamily)|nr:MBL fold metallo-hydrolase [Candidatus Adiutrix sp.]